MNHQGHPAIPMTVTTGAGPLVTRDGQPPRYNSLVLTLHHGGSSPLRLHNHGFAGKHVPSIDAPPGVGHDRIYVALPTGPRLHHLCTESQARELGAAVRDPSGARWIASGPHQSNKHGVFFCLYPEHETEIAPLGALEIDITSLVARWPATATTCAVSWRIEGHAPGSHEVILWKRGAEGTAAPAAIATGGAAAPAATAGGAAAPATTTAPSVALQWDGVVYANTSSETRYPVENPCCGQSIGVTIQNTSPLDTLTLQNTLASGAPLPSLSQPATSAVDVFYVWFATSFATLADVTITPPEGWMVNLLSSASLGGYWALAPACGSSVNIDPNEGVNFALSQLVTSTGSTGPTYVDYTWVIGGVASTTQTLTVYPQNPPVPPLAFPVTGSVYITTVANVQIPNPLPGTSLYFQIQNPSTEESFTFQSGDEIFVTFNLGDPYDGYLCTCNDATEITVSPPSGWTAIKGLDATNVWWTLSPTSTPCSILAGESVSFALSGPPTASGYEGFLSSASQTFAAGSGSSTSMSVAWNFQAYGCNSLLPGACPSITLLNPPAMGLVLSVYPTEVLPGEQVTVTYMATNTASSCDISQQSGDNPATFVVTNVSPPYNTTGGNPGTLTCTASWTTAPGSAATVFSFGLTPYTSNGGQGTPFWPPSGAQVTVQPWPQSSITSFTLNAGQTTPVTPSTETQTIDVSWTTAWASSVSVVVMTAATAPGGAQQYGSAEVVNAVSFGGSDSAQTGGATVTLPPSSGGSSPNYYPVTLVASASGATTPPPTSNILVDTVHPAAINSIFFTANGAASMTITALAHVSVSWNASYATTLGYTTVCHSSNGSGSSLQEPPVPVSPYEGTQSGQLDVVIFYSSNSNGYVPAATTQITFTVQGEVGPGQTSETITLYYTPPSTS